MISARAAGLVLAVLGAGYAALMFWLVGLLKPMPGPSGTVITWIEVFCGLCAVVAVVQLVLLGIAAKGGGTGPRTVSTVAVAVLCVAAVALAAALVVLWQRGAENALVGVFPVVLSPLIHLMVARQIHRMFGTCGRPRGVGPPGWGA